MLPYVSCPTLEDKGEKTSSYKHVELLLLLPTDFSVKPPLCLKVEQTLFFALHRCCLNLNNLFIERIHGSGEQYNKQELLYLRRDLTSRKIGRRAFLKLNRSILNTSVLTRLCARVQFNWTSLILSRNSLFGCPCKNYPLKFTHPEILKKIAESLGTFIRIDLRDVEQDKMRFARIQILLDLAKQRKETIWVGSFK